MPKTRVDDSRWPLVVCTSVGAQTDEDLEAYLGACEALLRRREPHGSIIDTRRSIPVSPKLRKRIVEWLSRNDALLRAYVVASGMVMSTPEQRGGLRAILWMRPLPFPYSVETSLDSATRYVCSRLVERGCLPPAPFNWGSVPGSSLVEKSRRGVDGG